MVVMLLVKVFVMADVIVDVKDALDVLVIVALVVQVGVKAQRVDLTKL